MTDGDPLEKLATLVRGRMELALRDKATFEREGQRLNGQLMQGEVNMAAAVLAWIDQLRDRPAAAEPEGADQEPGEERE
jgi:hypothetical protein